MKKPTKYMVVFAALLSFATPVFGEGELIGFNGRGDSGAEAVSISSFGFSMSLSPERATSTLIGMAVSAGFVDENNQIIGLNASHGNWNSKKMAPWDGIVYYDHNDYEVKIAPKSNVAIGDQSFDLNVGAELDRFMQIVESAEIPVFQSPLVINNFEADVRQAEDSPKDFRRFFFIADNNGAGFWQTTVPMTLYDATIELAALKRDSYDRDMNIEMAIALPMGEHDFCMEWSVMDIKPCGRNEPDFDSRVPNFIVFETGMN